MQDEVKVEPQAQEAVKDESAKVSGADVYAMGVHDGFETALVNLERMLILSFARKLHGIEELKEFFDLPKEKQEETYKSNIVLGALISAIELMRKDVPFAPANDNADAPKTDAKLDGGVILS